MRRKARGLRGRLVGGIVQLGGGGVWASTMRRTLALLEAGEAAGQPRGG